MRDRAVEAAFANGIARGANTEDALMVDSSFKALLMEYTATQSKHTAKHSNYFAAFFRANHWFFAQFIAFHVKIKINRN